MALKINLYKNNNALMPKAYNKWYGRAENSEPMSIKALANHMHEHNSVYDEGTITGVLIQMVKCIRELALGGQPVKIDNLAIIKCNVETSGATTPKEFDLNKNVKNIKMVAMATGEFTREELNKYGKLEYTSLAKSLRGDSDSDDDGGDGSDDQNP